MFEKTLKSKIIYKGKIVNLRVDEVLLPNKTKATREVVEHKGAVCAVVLTKNKNIVLVSQYRKPVDKVIWEIPAGVIEKGESLTSAVKRELLEETGSICFKIKKIMEFYSSPGFLDEKLHLFLAYEKKRVKPQNEIDENLIVKEFKISKALEMIKKGQIKDAKSIIGILWLAGGQVRKVDTIR